MIEYVQSPNLISQPIRNENFTCEKFQVFHLHKLPNDTKWLLVEDYDQYVQIAHLISQVENFKFFMCVSCQIMPNDCW